MNESEKERIREEETWRHQIREQLRKKTGWARLWQLLNSAFCLWFLSTIGIGLGTYLFTTWQQGKEATQNRKNKARSLETELGYRLLAFAAVANQVQEELEFRKLEKKSPEHLHHQLWNAYTFYFEGEHPLFSDFTKKNLPTLFKDLEEAVRPDDPSKADRIEQCGTELKKIKKAIDEKWEGLPYVNSEQDFKPYYQKMAEILTDVTDTLATGNLSYWATRSLPTGPLTTTFTYTSTGFLTFP